MRSSSPTRFRTPLLQFPVATLLIVAATVAGAQLQREVIDFQSACRQSGMPGRVSPAFFDDVVRFGPRRLERSPANGVSRVDRMYALQGDYHTFMQTMFGMDSLDGAGVSLKAVVGIRFNEAAGPIPQCMGNGYNAFWSSLDGLIGIPDTALDLVETVGHEFGHGIIHFGGNLEYEEESGALNESISDLIGIAFRAWLRAGGREGHPVDRLEVFPALWQLREPGGITRDMAQPRRAGMYPDHYSEYQPERGSDRLMHLNSSIMNQAWYLMTMGGGHPRRGGNPVSPMGLEKTVKIAVLAVRSHLSRTANFEEARGGLAQAAQALYGLHSPEWQTVHDAMDAIGVRRGAYRPLPAPTPTPDPSPTSAPAPTPAPTPAPAPARPAPEPSPPPPVQQPSGTSNLLLLTLMLACTGLAVLLLFRSRPAVGGNRDGPLAFATPGGSAFPSGQREASAMPASQARFVLEALDGSEPMPLDDRLLNTGEGVVLGRAAELCHVCMESRQVSRRHARAFRRNGVLFLEDLNSTHGTALDGRRLGPFEPLAMRAGQLIRISGFSYCLVQRR